MNRESLQPKRTMIPSNVIWAAVPALALALLAGMTTPPVMAQDKVTPPPTPPIITPPAGNVAYLLGHATGTQGYVCLPSGDGASWTVNSSRPQATLFVNVAGGFSQQILTHFLSPDTNPNQYAPSPLPFGSATWQSSFDSSVIWGNKLQSINAGTDPSCPTDGAIPCLLLQVIGSQNGPTRNHGILTNATYVQRLNTSGGSAPATGCAASTDVGSQVLVSYTADYYFYKAQQ
ncbi:MAG TPA: DUF3455 domain-containing protein [Bryobacteraceae bacterium]|nr:DUF3455 domain-containing protein [Bryobacteraceae bacterium]